MAYNYKSVFIAVLVLISTISISSAQEERPFIPGIRPLGMGGAFIALADDKNAYFYNPSGICQRKEGLTEVTAVPFTVNEPFLEIAKFMKDEGYAYAKGDITSEQLLVESIEKFSGLNMKYFIGWPVETSIVMMSDKKSTWGWSVFGSLLARVKVGGNIPKVDCKIVQDVIVMMPLSWRFHPNLAVGVNGKYIWRNKIEQNGLNLVDAFAYFTGARKFPILHGEGYGMDLGGMFFIKPEEEIQVNIGIMLSDYFGTKINYEEGPQTIRKQVNAGVCLALSGKAFPWGDKFKLVCDLHDIRYGLKYNDYVERSHIGIEGDWVIYKLRAGLNQGYPTFGVELSSEKTRIEYAFYGEELGLYPGHIAAWNHSFTVSFKFNAGLVSGKQAAAQPKIMPQPIQYVPPPPPQQSIFLY